MDATTHVALLRAVNVGGTGKLPMAELRAICTELGFGNVRTYIASGNVVFTSPLSETEIVHLLETRLTEYTGRPTAVLVRTAVEMRAVLASNPFPEAPGNRVLVTFMAEPPPADSLETVRGQTVEQVVLGTREVYVHYADGVAGSKLRIPGAERGTARNMNTIAKVVGMV